MGSSNQPTGAKPSDYPSWHNAVAGGMAGAGSRVVTAPLDLIRIRRQLSPRTQYPRETMLDSWKKIVQTEGGFTALFRGNAAAIYLWVGYSAVQFAVYNRIREILPANLPSTATAFVSGAVAGTCATLATYPCDVCRTTFAARGIEEKKPLPFHSLIEPEPVRSTRSSPPKTIAEFVLQLYQQRGVVGFYAGAGPAVVQIIPYMGISFAIYDAMTRGDRGIGLSAWAGSISGAVSKILVYPLDTVKRRLQAQAFFSAHEDMIHYASMSDCVRKIAENEGVPGFYRGAVPSVLKTAIATSLSFAIFRASKNALEVIHDHLLIVQ